MARWRGRQVQVPVFAWAAFVASVRGALGLHQATVHTFVACRWWSACGYVCSPRSLRRTRFGRRVQTWVSVYDVTSPDKAAGRAAGPVLFDCLRNVVSEWDLGGKNFPGFSVEVVPRFGRRGLLREGV